MTVPAVNSTLYLSVDYLNAADIGLFYDVLSVDCWISELVLTKDPVLKSKTQVMMQHFTSTV